MTTWDGVDFGGLTCREFLELVTHYLEGTLDPDLRARFEQHVDACPGCARYLDQIRATRQALGHVTLDSISTAARTQLLDAFRTWRSAGPGNS